MTSPSNFPNTKLPPTVWNQIEAEAKKREATGDPPRRIIQLHIGDAHLPFPRALTESLNDEERRFAARLNRYSDTFGEPALRKLILAKVRSRNQLPTDGIDSIQITAGATSALFCGFNRLLEPGSEVLTLAPYWSILRNVADAARVKLVEVPFFDRMASGEAFDSVAALERHRTGLTQAIYLNTPSNPTGMLLTRDTLERIADFAIRRDLWVFSDEAYEDYIWDGGEHVSIGSLPGMFQRTISVYTFSKCFGSSGIRVGYAVAQPPVISQINRAVVGSIYQAGRLGQLYAWRGMQRFDETLAVFRDDYQPTWRWVAANLRPDTLPCRGGFYYYIRMGDRWRGVPPEDKIRRLLDAGVVLAPGEYFGADYDGWARLCFTVVPPDDLREGVNRLNRLLSN
jgi:aspartate/methionine/tyrosine aminotransferase